MSLSPCDAVFARRRNIVRHAARRKTGSSTREPARSRSQTSLFGTLPEGWLIPLATPFLWPLGLRHLRWLRRLRHPRHRHPRWRRLRHHSSRPSLLAPPVPGRHPSPHPLSLTLMTSIWALLDLFLISVPLWPPPPLCTLPLGRVTNCHASRLTLLSCLTLRKNLANLS